MTNKLELVTRKELEEHVAIPSASTTENIAKYIRVGTDYYKFDVDHVITFELVNDSGAPRADYTLTDSQKLAFQKSGSKPLLLSFIHSGITTFMLLDEMDRGSGTVEYYGSDRNKLSFKVNLSEGTAKFESKGELLTGTELDAYISPSAGVDPTASAKSLKVGNTYWGFGTTDAVKRAGDTMTGPLALGGTSSSPAYITATETLGNVVLASPKMLVEGQSGTGIVISDTQIMIGGLDAGVGLVFKQPKDADSTLKFRGSYVLTEAKLANNLTTETAGLALDARQGKALADSVGTKQDKLTQMGSADVPIYVAEDGSVQPGNLYSGGTLINLNGQARGGQTAGLYAPLSGGTAGQTLISGGTSAPVWKAIVNDLTSTATDQPLSANMGKTLGDRIESLSSIGRFLSIWNATTGLPVDDPTVSPYAYKTGDYFIVGTTGSTNYKPSGAQYVKGVASTTVETGDVKTGDTYYYTTTGWQLNAAVRQEVSFRALSGSPSDNTALVTELAKYLPKAGGTMTGTLTMAAGQAITTGGTQLTLQSMGDLPMKAVIGNMQIELGKTGALLSIDSLERKLRWNLMEVLTKVDVVNDLTTGGTDVPLSAEMGKELARTKLDASGEAKMTGDLILGGGTNSVITTDSTEGLIIMSAPVSIERTELKLLDGDVLLGCEGAMLEISLAESLPLLTFNDVPILTEDSIVNDITAGGANKALSAEAGKTLAESMPRYFLIPSNSATAVETANGNGMMSIGGNPVAIGYDSDASMVVINGYQVASGTAVSIGKSTLTVSFTAVNKYTITSTVAGIFVG